MSQGDCDLMVGWCILDEIQTLVNVQVVLFSVVPMLDNKCITNDHLTYCHTLLNIYL